MSTFVAKCPRCKALNSTFGVNGYSFLRKSPSLAWLHYYEIFGVCRCCNRSSIFVMRHKDTKTEATLASVGGIKGDIGLNLVMDIEGAINLADVDTAPPPDHLPDYINDAFVEGSRCLAIRCYNAAGVMFRRCVDLMIKDKHPSFEGSLKAKLDQALAANHLSPGLKDLADCIREDGNDAAHNDPIGEDEAEDLMNFARRLLTQIYTEPKEVEISRQRRVRRNAAANTP